MKKILFALPVLTLLAGCDDTRPATSDQIMNRQQEQMSREAVQQVGLPAITNFFEKRTLKAIIELRDQGISTTTYIVAEQTGQLFKVCDSIGYGFPASTQYTNPQKVSDFARGGNYAYLAIPQADPNGLFSPASSDGTWVMCLDPSDKKDKAVYLEPKVIVSPFPITLIPVPFGK